MAEMAPFRIEPEFTARVWGFRDLRPWYDRIAEGDPIGEVWLTGDDCLIATGPHAGKRLGALFSEERAALLGPHSPGLDAPGSDSPEFRCAGGGFAAADQDDFCAREAQRAGASGRRDGAEIWRAARQDGVLVRAGQAEPGAEVAVGVKPGTTLAEIEEGIRAGTLEARLNMLPVCGGRHDLCRCGNGARDLAGIDTAGDAAELRHDLPHV